MLTGATDWLDEGANWLRGTTWQLFWCVDPADMTARWYILVLWTDWLRGTAWLLFWRVNPADWLGQMVWLLAGTLVLLTDWLRGTTWLLLWRVDPADWLRLMAWLFDGVIARLGGGPDEWSFVTDISSTPNKLEELLAIATTRFQTSSSEKLYVFLLTWW